LGVTVKDLGRLSEAESSYRRALQINPHYAGAHSNLGNILQIRPVERGGAQLPRALELEPDLPWRITPGHHAPDAGPTGGGHGLLPAALEIKAGLRRGA